METFNETANKLLDKLSEIADSKTTANMLHLVNCVTMEVIAKVLNFSFLKAPFQQLSLRLA